jgi:AraC-like DNA-binding protein
MDHRVKQLLLLAFDNQLTRPVKRIGKLSAEEIDKIYEVKDFLFGNLRTMYTHEEVSSQMNISEYQIRKGFQEIYGMTYIDLSNIERMHRASILIHKDGKKLWEIAVILGYSSKSSLLKAYKKYYGKTLSNNPPRN